MYFKLFCIFNIIFATAVSSRHVSDINDLDEEDQVLFRAAYDTPPYNQYEYNQYQYDDESEGKLDLFKDKMWAIKSKFLEMKTIEKALIANMLSSKLKLKELLTDKMKLLKPLKKHIHVEEKPSYYQEPSYAQYQPQKSYASPPQYAPGHYAPPAQQYAPSAQQYTPPAQHYSPPAQQYASQQYAPVAQYAPAKQQYTPPAQQYAPPQQYAQAHDPYYGH